MTTAQDDWGFTPDDIPAGNWFKFENVGDFVAGEVMEIFDKPSKNGLPAQRCFLLRQKNGEAVNVGIKKTSDYLMGRTNLVQPGDILKLEFKKIIPKEETALKLGDAKSIEVYVKKSSSSGE